MSPQPRGFALLTAEQRQELSKKGGRASVTKGSGHRWTHEEAKVAGRKGGLARRGPK
jgi:general stress protein YciG